jgi:hypothetical protein
MRPTPELERLLAPLGLRDHVELLAPYATIETALVADPAGELPIGGSRIGGVPDLPPDLAWPARRWPLAEIAGWPDFARAAVDVSRGLGQVWADGGELVMPIPFLLQLDLAAIADRRLPTRGVLACFAAVTSDIADPELAKRVAAAVIHLPDRDALSPRPHPPTVDLPPPRAIALRAEPAIWWNLPYEDRSALEQALPKAGFAALLATPHHALFAAPTEECAGPMPPTGELALLRVYEDDAAGFLVGDASWITFVISELDLRGRRFERTRASVYIG